MESKAPPVIVLQETTSGKGSSLSSLGDVNSDPSLDTREKELMKRAKSLVFGPKTSEVVDVNDWDLLEMVLSLDKGWVLLGEEQAKRTVSRNKAKSRKESKEVTQQVIKVVDPSEESENRQKKEDTSGSQTCNVCSQKLPSNRDLLRHLQDLHNLFKCPYCSKFITQRSHLYRHIRCVHRNVKNFSETTRGHVCQICFQKFSSREDLEEHLMGIHEDLDESQPEGDDIPRNEEEEAESGETESAESEEEDEEHRCQICYKAFQSDNHLRRHKSSVHATMSERVECAFCKKYYSSAELLKTHLERFHKVKKSPKDNEDSEDNDSDEWTGSSYPCPQCSESLKTSTELRRHLSSQHGFSNEQKGDGDDESSSPYECHICHKFLKTRKIHRRHLKNVHKMKLKRLVPTKNTSFRHKQKKGGHSGPSKKRAACFKCDLVVANKSNLKRHLIRIHGFKSNMSIDEVVNLQNKYRDESDGEEEDDSCMEEDPREEDPREEESPPISLETNASDDVEQSKTPEKQDDEEEKATVEKSPPKTLKAVLFTSPKTFANFKCRVCDTQFNKMNFLRKHVEREHAVNRFCDSESDKEGFRGFQADALSNTFIRQLNLLDCLAELIEEEECVVLTDDKFLL